MAGAQHAWERGPLAFRCLLLLLLSPVQAEALAQPIHTRSKGQIVLSQDLHHGPGVTEGRLRSSSSYVHSRQLAQNTEPPGGSYTLIADDESFVDMFTSNKLTKRMRLRLERVVQPCAALTVASGTKVVVDCRGATLDLRCVPSFVIGANASAELYECHVLWSQYSDFFNIASDTDTLRIEHGGVLKQRGGSSTVNCNVRTPLQCTDAVGHFGSSRCSSSSMHSFIRSIDIDPEGD
jgi:hypothetical protein